MKPTKKTLEAIKEIEKKVAKVCDVNDGLVDEITGITYPKTTTRASTNKEITINLNFGLLSPTLKKQIQNQGFKISNNYIKRAEAIRDDLNSLNTVGILKDKQLFKCFKRLNKTICKKIVASELKDGEIAVRKKNKQ